MALDEVLDRLKQQPFRPFRIHLRDGRHHDICQRHVSLVLRSSLLIHREDTPDGDAERLLTIPASDILEVEPVR